MVSGFFIDRTYTQIIFFYCGFGLVFMLGLLFVFRRLFPNFVIQEIDSDFISGMHAALFTITFLTLGYSLSNVNDTIDKFQKDVTLEANDLKSFDVLLTLYDTEEATQLRSDLRRYAQSIVTDEWPQLLKGKGSEETLNFQRAWRASLQRLNPTTGKELAIYSGILETTARIVQARSTRILDSNTKLARQFLVTNNIGYIGVLIISALMLTQFTWFRLISLTTQVIAVSFIFASTIVLDNPFNGVDRISPEPILNIAQSAIVKF